MRWRRASAALLAAAASAGGCAGDEEAAAPEGPSAEVGWTQVASMSQRRSYIAAAQVARHIYAAGGMVGETGRPLATFARYDTTRDVWQTLTPLPVPTRAAAAAAVGRAPYGMGGATPGGKTPVACGRELWVIGGRRGESILREVWTFAPGREGGWRRGPDLAEAMELLGAAVVEDEIHAVWEHVYQIYDATEGRWRQGPRPLVTRHGLEVFAAGGALYTVGGCTTALRDSPIVERLEL